MPYERKLRRPSASLPDNHPLEGDFGTAKVELLRQEAAKEKLDKIREYQMQIRENRAPKIDQNKRDELKKLMEKDVTKVRSCAEQYPNYLDFIREDNSRNKRHRPKMEKKALSSLAQGDCAVDHAGES